MAQTVETLRQTNTLFANCLTILHLQGLVNQSCLILLLSSRWIKAQVKRKKMNNKTNLNCLNSWTRQPCLKCPNRLSLSKSKQVLTLQITIFLHLQIVWRLTETFLIEQAPMKCSTLEVKLQHLFPNNLALLKVLSLQPKTCYPPLTIQLKRHLTIAAITDWALVSQRPYLPDHIHITLSQRTIMVIKEWATKLLQIKIITRAAW